MPICLPCKSLARWQSGTIETTRTMKRRTTTELQGRLTHSLRA